MTPGRPEQLKELFESVRDSTPEERHKILEPVRARDPRLCEEVEALLQQTKTSPLGPAAFQDLNPLEGPPPSLLEQRYRLERPIGRGGFGIVYLARDERLHNKPVVVKFLIGETRRDEWFRKKFRDEIEALSRLDHPGIVGILDAGQTPAGTPYLVMQYVQGVTLRSLIIPGGLDLPTTAHLVQEIGQALAAAHSRGVFHRDLKPENIMVQPDDAGQARHVRLIDFGIATIREQGFERAAEPTRVAGSLSYMAPEQFRGQPAAASDIFAMGVIAWELLAGKLPFRNRSPVQAMAQPNFLEEPSFFEEIDELLHLRPEVPGAAIAAIRKALAIEPADRFQTATAFGDELAQALRTPSVAPRTPSVQQRMLDVAMARQIPIHKPAEVMALIRRTESGGLAAVLQLEEDHSVAKEDIRSKPFQLEFPVASSGSLKPLELGLRLECPDFEPKSVSKTLLVPPAGDSDACTFLITPLHLGELRVNIELTRGDVLVASRALKTESTPSDRKIADPSKILVSIPLSVLVRASEGVSAGEFTRMFQPPGVPPTSPAEPPKAPPPRAGSQEQARLAALEKALQQARSLLDRGQAAAATQVLDRLTVGFPGDSQVVALRLKAEAEHQRAIAERQRQEAERRAREETARRHASEPQSQEAVAPAAQEGGEFTRVFQPPPVPLKPPAERPAAPPPSGTQAGEFTRVFQAPAGPAPPTFPVPLAPPPVASGPEEPASGALPWRQALGMGAAVGAVLALTVIIGVVSLARRRAQQQVASSEVTLEIATVPPGATVRINGDTRCASNCNLSLPAGDYQVTAFLEGYEVAASGVELLAGKHASISLRLEPQPPSLRILTDLDQGKIVLDDQPAVDLQDGQYNADRLQPGTHTLNFAGKSSGASFSFEVSRAALPTVSGLTVRNLKAILLTSFGSQARVFSNTGPLKLAVNGQPEADAGPAGVDLKNFKPGMDGLVAGDGNDRRSMTQSFGPSPMLTLFLNSDVNMGTLIVSTGGEDDVKVFLNNREYRQTTARGQLRIHTIGPQTVRVAKEGYDVALPQQTVEVRKGAETRLEFKLTRFPVVAALVISGVTPGADVYIDNNKAGTTGPEGGFVGSSINPGDHEIELRRDGFGPKRFRRSFRAGQTVTVSGAEVTLEAVRLPPPPYPPPQTDKQKEVAKEKASPPAPKEGTMADFEDPSQWRQERGVYLHRGQAFLAYKLPAKGIFTFTVQLLKGGNFFRGGKVRWCVNYVDDKNYDLFEVDSKSFSSRVMQDGKLYERSKVALKDLTNQWFAIQIDVTPEHIVHKMFVAGEWINLDSWAEVGRNFSQGKFGFLVQGNDEIGLSDFKFQPK